MPTLESSPRRAREVGRHAGLLLVAGLLACAGSGAGAEAPIAPVRSATLPLDDLLELHETRRAASTRDRPPIPAVLERLEIEGRMLEQGLAVRANVQVEVLAEERWVAIPLLDLEPGTVLEELPAVADAALAVVDGRLTLVARRKGRFAFAVRFSTRATKEGPARVSSIAFADATLVRCRLGFDAALFEPTGSDDERLGDTVTVRPRAGRCEVRWRVNAGYARAAADPAPAPEADPVIPRADASLVSTLEGEHILRASYRLRFEGLEPIEFALPAGYRLLRATLDGGPVEVRVEGQRATLEASAARAGERGASLELVFAASDRSYLLSGSLALALPRPSWRVNELYLSTHLPAVFDYAWTSGTLSPVTRAPEAGFVYDIPTPGKRLHFRQFLVHDSTPSLTLEYEVSLEGHYFQGER